MGSEGFMDDRKAYEFVYTKLSFYTDMLQQTNRIFAGCTRILDVGSGPGIFEKYYREQDQRIISLDCSYAMIRGQDITAVLGDAACLPFFHESFEGIAAHNVLPFLSDYPAFLRECYNSLGENGRFVVTGMKKDFNPEPLIKQAEKDLAPYRTDTESNELIDKVMKWNKDDIVHNVQNYFSLEKMCRLLRDHGFGVAQAKHIYEGQSYFVVGKKGDIHGLL